MNTIETNTYDAIIADWTMSGASGLDLIEHVKQKSPHTVTILMTGWEIKDSIVEDHPDIDLTLSKPFDQHNLNQALSKASQIRQDNLESNKIT